MTCIMSCNYALCCFPDLMKSDLRDAYTLFVCDGCFWFPLNTVSLFTKITGIQVLLTASWGGGGAEVEVPPALYRITSDLFYPIYLSVQLQITKPLAVISVSGCVLSYGNDRSNWGMLFCLSESHHHSHLPLIPMWTNSQASSNRHFETLKTTVP